MGGRNSAAKIGKKTIKLLALTKRSWLTCGNLLILSQSNQKAAKRTCAPGPAYSQLKTRFRLKMHEMFLSTLRRRWENATNTDYCGFGLEEDSNKEITLLSRRHRFRKALFFVISMDGLPNCEINAAFTHFSRAVLTGPWFIVSCTLERCSHWKRRFLNNLLLVRMGSKSTSKLSIGQAQHKILPLKTNYPNGLMSTHFPLEASGSSAGSLLQFYLCRMTRTIAIAAI